ncbi:S-layer homology domain-containing protein [Paenibacillus sp. GCM10012306]
MILSLLSVLEVSAAPLKVDVISADRAVDSTQKIVVSSVLDVTYTDIPTLQDIEFSLFKDGIKVGSQIKNKEDVKRRTITDTVYSMEFTNLSFEGLKVGEAYSLQAQYMGKDGLVTTEPQTIRVPATTKINLTVERMPKNSNTYIAASTGEIRSDDQKLRLTVTSEGVPLVRSKIVVDSYYSEYRYAITDTNGQVELNKSEFNANRPVLFVFINQGTEHYEAWPLYVTDLQPAGTHTVAIRYLDETGKLAQSPANNISLPYGASDRVAVPGYDVLTLSTGSISGSYSSYIWQIRNQTLLFQTSQAALFSAESGTHKEIIQDASDFSWLSFDYTWNGKPLTVESYSIVFNDQYKQITRTAGAFEMRTAGVYVPKNKEYDITALASLPGTKDKIIIRSQVRPVDSETILHSDAVSADYSALKLQIPDLSTSGLGKVEFTYLNNKYNVNRISTYFPIQATSLYVEKGEEIHRLTATAVSSIPNNSTWDVDQVVIASFFSPTDSEYALTAGSTYDTNIVTSVSGSNYYDGVETRNEIVLGETVDYQVVMEDEYKNSLDMSSNYRVRIVDESGTVIEDNSIYWSMDEKDGQLRRADKRQWKPAKSGTYKIQLLPYYYSSGKYVYGELLHETVLKVTSKQELDIEIRGKDGKLVDLVDEPYLNTDQSENMTVTVRQHVTGAQGPLLAGVEISRFGELIGVTDSQGHLTLPQGDAGYFSEFIFKKQGYLSKVVSLAIIDPQTQAVVRVQGLDKPEGDSYAGGVPLDNAYVMAKIKKEDGTFNTQSRYIDVGKQQAFLVTQSPSVVDIDFIRYSRTYMGVQAKYGYYMYGSIVTEPGKEYSMVLDARQPLQQVSKVKLTQVMNQLSLVRKDMVGSKYVPYVINNNTPAENYFYATEGTYSVLSQPQSDTFIYRDDVIIGAGDHTLVIDDSLSTLATLVAPAAGAIYSVEYATQAGSTIVGYAYDAAQVQLTPGEVTVQVGQSVGGREYQYDIHFSAGILKAGTTTQLALQTISGLDIFDLKDGKLVLPTGDSWFKIGLMDTAGNRIGQIRKPLVLVSGRGSSSGSTGLNPTAASYEIQDVTGKTLFKSTADNYYPLSISAIQEINDSFQVLPSGNYVLKAQMTIDGQTYTLNKTFELESSGGTVVDPGGNNPGNGGGNGPGPGTEPGPGNNPGPGTNPGPGPAGGGGNPGAIPAAPTVTVNDSVAKQNAKLQELLKDGAATAAERASAAQSALASIAESLKAAATSEEAEQNSKSLSQALESATQLLGSIQDAAAKQKIVTAVSELVGSAPYLLNKLDTADKAVSFAQTLIQNAAAVLKNASGVPAEEILQLKNGVISSSQAALNKAGEVTIAKEDVSVTGSTVTSQLSKDLINKQIVSAKQALTTVTGELNTKLGAGSAQELKLSLTVKVPPMGEGLHKLNTTLPAEVLTLVKENGIDGLKLQMDHTAFTIAPDTFGAVEAGQNITLAAEVVQNAIVNKPNQAEPLAKIPVMEFSASIGGKTVEAFAKPMKVTFDVSSIDPAKYSGADLEKLTLYVLNDKSLTWEAVGGKYDPITQTVSTLRGHFSRYTVMLGKAVSFTDVPATHWATKEIHDLLTKGIVDQAGEFHPSKQVTRIEFASWIARAYGLEGKGITLPFKDIAPNNDHYNELAAVYAAGIISGKSTAVFDPEASITRQEMATMLARALKTYNGVKSVAQPDVVNGAFTDGAKISKWAADSVALTKSTQLFGGFEDKTFRPNQTASKAEAAALIYRLYRLK